MHTQLDKHPAAAIRVGVCAEALIYGSVMDVRIYEEDNWLLQSCRAKHLHNMHEEHFASAVVITRT